MKVLSAKEQLFAYVACDSNEKKALYVCTRVCKHTEKGVWDTRPMMTSAQLLGWEWGRVLRGGKQGLLFIIQTTGLCSEFFIRSQSHIYF